MRRKAYAAVSVKHVDVGKLIAGHGHEEVIVGFDVGKYEILAVSRWPDRSFARPWRIGNPLEVPVVVSLLQQIQKERKVVAALESSGTYGEALRYWLHRGGIPVQRVSSKASHDYAEIFDGVPSQHDGKDGAVIAELAGQGKGVFWPYEAAESWEEELGYWVEELEGERKLAQWQGGLLESLLALHWPEATRVLSLSSGTLLRALAHYGDAARLAADSDAEAKLLRWGGRYLQPVQAAKLAASARTTVGVPTAEWSRRRLQECAQKMLHARAGMRQSRRQLHRSGCGREALAAQGAMVGLPTACVLWSCLGDPRDYESAGAYRKAMGLNLAERSSGIFKGKLRISKRGPSRVRQWLYYAALRLVQQAGVSQWYQAKKAKDGNEAKRALVAVMRKLALALHGVAVHGTTFSAARLFPGRAQRPPRQAQAAEATSMSLQ